MKKGEINIGLVVLLLIITLVVIFGATTYLPKMTGNTISSSFTYPKQICKDVQVSYDYLEEYKETVPYADTVCEPKVLVYNRGSFRVVSSICNQKIEECQEYFLGICTDKIIYCADRTVTCSLEINNLDDEYGIWKVDFDFLKLNTNDLSDVEATASQRRRIDPHASEEVVVQGRITSKELYDIAYTCNYNIVEEPTKQVCRDVTKYKEVTKTRTVTRYRTEEQCE